MQNQNQAAADFRGIRIDNETVAAASRLATEMFNARDFSGLRRYIDDANNKEDGYKRSLGLSMLYGVGRALLHGLRSAEKADCVKFTGDKLPTPDELLYSFKTDAALFVAQLNAAVSSSLQLGKASSVTLSVSAPAGLKDRTERSSDAPIKVEIVGMPTRETAVSVARDSNGDILGATHVEADAA